jgi:hypothetical protein
VRLREGGEVRNLIQIKAYRNKNFSVLSLEVIDNEKHLSWKAKGVHTYLITRPPDWQINFKDICNRAEDNEWAVRSALKELENRGYLIREQLKNDDGGQYCGYVYRVFQDLSLKQKYLKETKKAKS